MSDAMTTRRPLARDAFAQGGPERAPTGEPALSTADLAGGGARHEEAGSAHFAQADREERSAPLFPSAEAQTMRTRWDSVQAGFVDEPRRAVEDADALVAGAMRQLAERFADERAKLERQWDNDGQPSTEDLRLALQSYRAFFTRLLAL